MGVDRTWSLIQQKFGPFEIFPNFVSVFPIMTQHHKGAFGTLPLFWYWQVNRISEGWNAVGKVQV